VKDHHETGRHQFRALLRIYLHCCFAIKCNLPVNPLARPVIR
jgi:hypothetical protein